MRINSKTDIGKKRSSNQDAYFAGELENGAVLGIVCDGMGGANAGNIASSTAIKLISEYILRSYRLSMDDFEIEKMLSNAIKSANLEVFEASQNNSDLAGMGTTVVAALIQNETAIIAHVGDSRIYLLGDEIKQLTKDHSVVQSLIESGKISVDEAKSHPRKNVITRALGAEEDVIVDTASLSVSNGQTLLLCTDGLTSMVDSDKIFNLYKEKSAEDLVSVLIEEANQNGGADNITVVTLEV